MRAMLLLESSINSQKHPEAGFLGKRQQFPILFARPAHLGDRVALNGRQYDP